MTVKLDDSVIDELIKECKSPEDFFGEKGVIKTDPVTVFRTVMLNNLPGEIYAKIPSLHLGI